MSDIASIFASPNSDNFQDLMRKNFKKGVKTLTQVSFNELETGHLELYNVAADTSRNLDVIPKYLSDFNVVGFDIEVFFGEIKKDRTPTLVVAGAGWVTEQAMEFLAEISHNDQSGSWVELVVDALENIQSTGDDFKSILESLQGDLVLFIFKDGELFVFSSTKELRADNRLNLTATALAFSKAYPARTLYKVDVANSKLFPVLALD
jgi:hypothetical protein